MSAPPVHRTGSGRAPARHALAAAALLALLPGCGQGKPLPRTARAAGPDVLPIGAVQGRVAAGIDARGHGSPLVGRTVAVRGVVHLAWAETAADGRRTRGFLLQNTPRDADGDPATSDGLFVRTGSSAALPGDDGFYTPVPGDEIELSGRVTERRGHTALAEARLLRRVAHHADLDAVLPPAAFAPPDDLREATVAWERVEGMRVALPAGALVLGAQAFDWWHRHGVVTVVAADHPLALRADPFARRAFRDAHPLDHRPGPGAGEGNGFRVPLGDHALAAREPPGALPAVRTFDRLAGPLRGGVVQADDRYLLELDEPPALQRGADPAGNRPVLPPPSGADLRVATFNVENLYDALDDPFDPRDYAPASGNGPPRLFNYVPDGVEAYGARLRNLALQVVHDLGAPDLLLVQEVEDQDIRRAGDDAGSESWVNDADGVLDGLRQLAGAIRAAGGPPYASACDRAAADERGIVCAFLYRPGRVRLVDPPPGHVLLGAGPPRVAGQRLLAYRRGPANPRALNALDAAGRTVFARAPQVAWFERVDDGTRFYAVSNHFRSRPDAHVELRRAQAAFAAALAAALRVAEPGADVIVGGDLNTFPRPDEPVPLEPADQLGPLYDAGLRNLYDRMLSERPAAAYTYVWQGQAQTLDQLFVSPGLAARLRAAWAAHINSDFTADPAVPGRGTSDHDPVVAVFAPAPPP